jgi:hypothetical protein
VRVEMFYKFTVNSSPRNKYRLNVSEKNVLPLPDIKIPVIDTKVITVIVSWRRLLFAQHSNYC